MTGNVPALMREIINRVYPVGCYIDLATQTDPNTAIGCGTTWKRITDGRALIASNDSYPLGWTGGESEHALTTEQLPIVTGTVVAGSGNAGSDAKGYGAFRSATGVLSVQNERQYGMPGADYCSSWPSGDGYERINLSFGGGESHENMQPSLAVNRWLRTA